MDLAIVNEIKRQIVAGGRIKVMSWGTRGWVALSAKSLRFRVDGFLHSGFVEVHLTSMDDYTVKLTKLDGTVKKEINMVYCDNLTEVIDNNVERIPAHKR